MILDTLATMMQRLGMAVLLSGFLLRPACAGVLISKDSTARYFKGLSEASSPDVTAWRQLDFNDSDWASGWAAFYYENQPASSNAYTGNTVLSDMFGNYTCIFLRQRFVVTNYYDIGALQVAGLSDDGYIAWINGQEVGRFNMPDGDIPYSGTSKPALSEPVPWWTNRVTGVQTFLVPGTNVLAVQAFNCNLGSSSDFMINPALYYEPNSGGPAISLVYPATGATVRQLNSVEVGFSVPVTGVDAADLLINGQPASELTVVTPWQFVFSFSQPPTGAVQVAWAADHGITDLSTSSNAFAGGSWSYTLDPAAPWQDVIISEFMADNSGNQTNSVHDELGGSPDWIELYNGTGSAVSLTGWGLTDVASKPSKWVFPATVLPAKAYLLVLASGRDTNVNGQLHTSFKISASSGYLALTDPAGNAISVFTPTYPPQYTDVSYGRDRLDPTLVGYYTNSTPGTANSTRGAGFGPDVHFSRAGGTFRTDFLLTLTTSDTNSDIRYVLMTTNVASGAAALTNVPTAASPLYTGPLLISNGAQVRARSFPRQAGLWPGAPHTECYVKISAAAATFSSDLPVIILDNLAGGSVPQTTDQSVIAMVFEPVNGKTSLTNPPTLVTRAGLNVRGSSTAGLPQSSFALELWDEFNADNQVELLGLPAESDWVLYAQDGFDPSCLHNPLIHELSRQAGRYSSRTRYAEVFLNTSGGVVTFSAPAGGNYFGLYTLEEKIKRSHGRVDIEKLEPQVTNAPALTGGYLLKIDRADANERTFYDSYLQGNIIYQDPPGLEMITAARRPQAVYISNYFRQFGAALWGANYTNPVSGYAAWIDVDAWIDHHILNALAFNVDAFRLSGYFFKDRDQKIAMGPLWDFDRSQGTFYSGDARCFNPRLWRVQTAGDQGTDFFGNPGLLGVRWWQRLFTDPDFWQRWIDRWTELRRGTLHTNNIFAAITSLSSQLTLAQPREAIRFTYTAPRGGVLSANGYGYSFPGTYQGELAFLKRWLTDRTEFIDTNFLRAPVFSRDGGAITSGFTLTITAPTIEASTTTYYTLNGTDPRLPGGAINPAAISNRAPINLVLTSNARVFARNYNLGHSNLTGGAIGGNPPISSPWSGPTVATFVAATPTLAITEIMYHPPPSSTNDGDDFEFIELKNTGAQALNLVGIRFTNGIDFTFTATNAITSLGPGQYAVLVRNATAFASRYPGVTNVAGQYALSLENAGERLYLEGALKEPILDFSYKDSWVPVTDGVGFSLVIRNEYGAFSGWTNPASWRASSTLYGSPGRGDPAPADITPVVINEALTHTDPPQVDTVELFNPTATPANIGGWFLTDDHKTPVKYVIPTNTVVPAYGYAQITENEFATGANGFALSSLGEEIYLFSGDGTNPTGYRHGFEFGPQINGVTFGRQVTSDGQEHFVTQQGATLGWANTGAQVGPVIINEIYYAPPPFGLNADTLDEYIELRNVTATTAPLYDPLHPENTWKVDGGVQFTFPPGASIAPLSYLLLVHFDPVYDPVMLAWFCSRYSVPTNTPIYGPFTGNLANEGERVALYLPDKPEVPPSPVAGFVPYVLAEEVHYSNRAPWPTNTDGAGSSLCRRFGNQFADDPANWLAGLPTPGRTNLPPVGADSDGDGLPDLWEIANGLDPNDPNGINGPAGDPDGDGQTNWQEYLAGTNPLDAGDALRVEGVRLTTSFIIFQFNTHTNRAYAIERRDGFDPATPWTVWIGNITGNNAPYVVYDPRVAVQNGRFYRVRVSFNP